MPWAVLLIFFFVSFLAVPVRAIEMNNAFDTTPPTSSNIPNWNTGWPASNVTGWNYVGQIAGASGVYIGNGWVLTAGHIGFGNFTLNGVTYTAIGGTGHAILDSDGDADLYMFQIANPPNLLPLPIRSSDPVAFSPTQAGSLVAMLGFGGGNGNLTWGVDNVTEINEYPVTPSNYSFVSNDFFTDDGEVQRGSSTITNESSVVSGDSGGGDFIYNTTTRRWELAGINEVTGSYDGYNPVTDQNYDGNGNFSGMVQLDNNAAVMSTYASQINAYVSSTAPISDTPTMPLPALVVMGCLLFFAAARSFKVKDARS